MPDAARDGPSAEPRDTAGERVDVDSAAALADWLRERRPDAVRLAGLGSRHDRLPPPRPGAVTVSLRRLSRIERLAADDLTCSVEPGVRCADLDAALAERRLWLGCLGGGDGTVGGLFATDPAGAGNVGGPEPRTALLGTAGVLADGTRWKSGARVVKSVAGFDVHRLLVGSRGLAFAATLLHLKLRPLPPARVGFVAAPEPLAAALARFVALRRAAPAPGRLWLQRHGGAFVVGGRLDGRAAWIRSTLRDHALREADGAPHAPQAPAAPAAQSADVALETVAGIVRPSRVAALAAALPADAPLLVHGGGRFEARCPPAAIDALLHALPALDASGAVVGGAPARRGLASAEDQGAAALQRALRACLDPRGVWT